MSIVCEEVFEEGSHPSAEEVRDYALKIGIDPTEEPQLLPIAAEALMKALPPAWKPCFDEKSKSFYYYNRTTGKTQWEHPLDDIYRNLVKKARTDSSISLGEPTDDATFNRDEFPSLEEPPLPSTPHPSKKLDPNNTMSKLGNRSVSPRILKKSPTIDLKPSPKHESLLVKQKSEDHILMNRKLTLNTANSLSDDLFEKHPKIFDTKSELKVTGGGSMFLKSNTKKLDKLPDKTTFNQNLLDKKSILRDPSLDVIKNSRLMDDENLSLNDEEREIYGFEKKEKPEEEDKKSVRFNLHKNPQFEQSDKNINDDEQESFKNLLSPVFQVSVTPQNKPRSPFTLPLRDDVLSKPPIPKKVIKPNPTDYIKPTLLGSKSSDSEDDLPCGKVKRITLEEIDLESDDSDDSPDEEYKKTKEHAWEMERGIEKLKEKMWKMKNDELVMFQENLEKSHKEEIKRIFKRENDKHGIIVEEQVEKLRTQLNNKTKEILDEENTKLSDKLQMFKLEQTAKFNKEETELKENFELKKEELEKYYEDKLVEIETQLAEAMEKNRDDLIMSHNSILEQLKQNNAIIIEQIKKELKLEEEQIRKEHRKKMEELKETLTKELKSEDSVDRYDQGDKYEKLRCEKRLLEDKYKCLKEKYVKLKNDVRSTIEKRNKKKEEGKSCATNTTGSETERSFSRYTRNSLEADHPTVSTPEKRKQQTPPQKNLEKPPTPKHSKTKTDHRGPKEISPNDNDTSISDRSEDKTNKNDYDTSDNSFSNGRSRRKLFSRAKSNSTNRARMSRSAPPERSCSPVENLRRQLQKLEDLEDQFPQNQQSDTYHLRIHLERDSIKRAKESLRNQKVHFQQRQKDLKLKHGTMARHTYQQLCQEEKDLTDMEVSLHRTRSLLGEKVIRLRHLEQTLQRATVPNEPKADDATLSDLSSHSASSGISSTEFADANFPKGILKVDSLQEPSEIIQSLENLNAEIQEIWDVLRKQQQQSGNFAAVLPPFVYPDLGWPVLAGTAAALPAPPSIPTLADRLNNYRQHIALANAQSTVVTHAAHQGATTTLVERTRNLRHWLKQAGMENNGEGSNPQANL